jgi:hypothetical protein
VIQGLEKHESNIRGIATETGLGYNVVVHHLRLLEAERMVTRKGGKKPFVWALTGVGQQRLVNMRENSRV